MRSLVQIEDLLEAEFISFLLSAKRRVSILFFCREVGMEFVPVVHLDLLSLE